MINKIDIHSHILPGIDDGAGTMEESVQMLKRAAQEGISEIIVTPHFHYRRGHAAPQKVQTVLAELQDVIKKENIKIRLYAGNELYYTHELLEIVKNGEALTMAGTDYVLLEFSAETEKRRIQNAVYDFLSEGYLPIVAHIERYQAFAENQEFAEELSKMGAYYQVNADSLSGKFGWKMKHFARHMVQSGLVQFVATDAHDLKHRLPVYGKAEEWMRKKIGEFETQQLLVENPKKLLQNQII